MMVMSMMTTMTMVMMTKMTMAAMCSGERGTRKQLFRLARPRQSNLISIIIAITMMITFADEDHDGKGWTNRWADAWEKVPIAKRNSSEKREMLPGSD